MVPDLQRKACKPTAVQRRLQVKLLHERFRILTSGADVGDAID
jgi:hypothetical protein